MVVRFARLGLLVDDAWFCSHACVEAEAAAKLENVRIRQRTPRPVARPLGAVLVASRVVTTQQLGEALQAQAETGLRLGAQLQRMGFASRDEVLRALSSQHGVSYLATVDTTTLRSAPGRLSADEVRALGIIPFRETAEALMVACAAPLPHAALDALGVLSGRAVKPFLVADDDFERLKAAYRGAVDAAVGGPTLRGAPESERGPSGPSGDAPVKARYVDPFTWVRIAADGQISTLLVPPP